MTSCLAAYGSSNAELVIEEFLKGEEVSYFALCDGERAVPFSSAQDHKRVGDGDTGPNTGGMGAYSPPPLMTAELSERVMREIIRPTVRGMAQRGAPYRGVLFAGLMIDGADPKLIEYNVRFGDPEAEVILARLTDDILPLLEACAKGSLRSHSPTFSSDAALAVVMAARGYPGEPIRGSRIGGLHRRRTRDRRYSAPGWNTAVGEEIVSDGGRVLCITALGRNVAEAKDRAYAAVDRIDWPDGFCRRDIGSRAIENGR